ncbi:ELKS/Rab6-interacting/CAST family member 1-like isoform X2 [Gigantopelta aegis]|uniref:ELKS/Rab6-interacting/CAST family member 1-like isoform X2 n=1 Tax=Gigantopelta aegis TaxID=1735272 RepID=UPI001B88E444|nr:ELKS/Rab6-interacting/CAST family member 1-like isoform X2 [Gigantopelta aegis]
MFGKSHKGSGKHSKADHNINYGSGVSRTGSGMRDLSGERSSKSSLNFVSRSASLGRERGRTASDSSAASYSGRHGPVSPLNLPSDNMQPMSSSYNQGYIIENLGISGMALSLSGKSPLEANPVPMYSRAHSLTNVTRERSLDRLEKEHVLMGERSLDRMHPCIPTTRESVREMEYRNYINSGSASARDRSLDREREYPHMGARSLERDHHGIGRSRSSERNGEYMGSYLSPSPTSQSEYRNSLLFELQVQVSELHKECAKLQKELDNTKDKLSSSMNSIKTFWSPELKKERSLRKEETAKCNMLNEHLKVAQAERQKDAYVIENLEASQGNSGSSQALSYECDSLKKDKDRQLREILILRKTIDEMELRIGTQKQTLAARDESIKKLLEMLQSKGLATGKLEEERKEVEQLQSQVIENEQRVRQLVKTLDERDKLVNELKEQMDRMKEEVNEANLKLKQQPASTHTMQAMLEAKESRISALENEVLNLEDKLLRIQEDGITGEWERRDGSLKNSPSTKDKSLRIENQQMKTDVARKDNQLAGLRMKVETLERQHTEQKQYIVVLKEQITAKELHSGMLQADIEDLQERLKEKDSAIEKKSLHSQNVSADRRRMETEMSELRDHLDIRERKVNVLQRKIETLEHLVNEKDELLNQTKMKLSATFTDSTDSAVSSLEESLHEKDKQLERLREQRDKMIKEHQEELDLTVKGAQDAKAKVDSITQELNEKQTQMCELREEATELRSEKFACDNKIRQLQSQLSHKVAEVEKLHQEAEKENQVAAVTARRESIDKELGNLQMKVTQAQDDARKTTGEVEKLQEIIKRHETEKAEKESQIQEMQEIIKEYKQKMGTLKRNQRTEKEKNAQLLEEARKSEKNLTDDASQLQNVMHQKHERIEELEEALRESVRITAQREMDMAEQKEDLEAQRKQVLDLKSEIDSLLLTKADLTAKVSGLSKQQEEKDTRLKRLQSERQKHLQEVFEMKQEAIQAAISEKDANIALLEMTSTKKQTNAGEMERLTKEKEKLNQQLKELRTNHQDSKTYADVGQRPQ